jgi:hypothetical protein
MKAIICMLEELLSVTEQCRDSLPPEDRNTWQRIAAETADLREVLDAERPAVGVFRLQEENPDSAYVRLDEQHELIAHRSDEGIVLDVWKDGGDQDGPVWTTYFYDDEMMPDDEE